MSLEVRNAAHLPLWRRDGAWSQIARLLSDEFKAKVHKFQSTRVSTPRLLQTEMRSVAAAGGNNYVLLLHVATHVSVFERDEKQLCRIALQDSVRGRPSSMIELSDLIDHALQHMAPSLLVVFLELSSLATSARKPAPDPVVIVSQMRRATQDRRVSICATLSVEDEAVQRNTKLGWAVYDSLASSAYSGQSLSITALLDDIGRRAEPDYLHHAVVAMNLHPKVAEERLPGYIRDDLFSDDPGSRLDAAVELNTLAMRGNVIAREWLRRLENLDRSSEVRAYAYSAVLSTSVPSVEDLLLFGVIPPAAVEMARGMPPLPALTEKIGGVGVMGVNVPLGQEFERPEHHVVVEHFRLALAPITNLQYLKYVIASEAACPGHWDSEWVFLEESNYPVVMVSWYEAVRYCKWLTDECHKVDLIRKSQMFMLPTEAQWEVAARNFRRDLYPWGNNFRIDQCNVRASGGDRVREVNALGMAGTNDYGCTDLIGNVWEWTRSLWGMLGGRPTFLYPYVATDGREDLDASGDVRRVVRGGAFYYATECLNSYTRNGALPSDRHPVGGFRIALVGT